MTRTSARAKPVRTILVVEDDANTRKLFRTALRRAGHKVLEAPAGASALARVQRTAPDFIFIDLALPDMDGISLVDRIRRKPDLASVPIVAISEAKSKRASARALDAGFNEVLIKPVKPSRILEVVRTLGSRVSHRTKPLAGNVELQRRLSSRENQLSVLGQSASQLTDLDRVGLPGQILEHFLSAAGIVKAAVFDRDAGGDAHLLSHFGFSDGIALTKNVREARLLDTVGVIRKVELGPKDWVVAAPLKIGDELVGLFLAVPAKAAAAEDPGLFAGAVASQLGIAIGLLKSVRDLRVTESKLARVFECASEGLLFIDKDLKIRHINASAAAIAGVQPEVALGVQGPPAAWKFFKMDGEPMPPNEGVLTRALVTGRLSSREEFIIQTPTRQRVIVSGAAAPVHDHVGKLLGVMLSVTDLSDQRRAEERLRYLAAHDVLTDLPNRLLLGRNLDHAIARASRRGERMALLFIDLDQFKTINDTMGHGVGDEVLVVLASRLVRSVRAEDTVARTGGDEFVIVLSGAGTVDYITPAVDRILKMCRQSFEVSGSEIHLSVSIGVSVYPTDGADPETLLRNADAALYEAKGAGRDCFRFFAPTMHSEAVERLEIERDLRLALERDELRLLYQPILRCDTRQLDSVEALVRWQHPERGLLNPGHFIRIAVHSGLIVPIGDWVLSQACQTIAELQQEGHPDVGIALNLSGRQFAQPDFIDRIRAVIHASGVDYSKLTFEITESEAMTDPARTIGVVNALRNMGSNVSIDDFGTGYSSLAYLQQYNASHLKLDGSFVRDVTTKADSAMIARAIIRLGHGLGMQVVGEGVESKEQAEFLEAQHCDLMQGYYFCVPVDRTELRLVLKGELRPISLALRSEDDDGPQRQVSDQHEGADHDRRDAAPKPV